MAEESPNPTPPPPPQPQTSPEPPADQPPPPPAETEVSPPPPLAAVAPPPAAAEEVTESAAAPRHPEEAQESKSLATMMEREVELPPPSSEPPPPKEEVVAVVAENVKDKEVTEHTEDKKVPLSLVSFKEESNKVADLSDSERKALQELKHLVQEALNTHLFTKTTTTQEPKPKEEPKKEGEPEDAESLPDEVSIWGIPLLKDDRSDVILLKFLRARDFKVKEAFVMIRKTIRWRKEFKIDELLDEDLGDDLDKVVFMHGYDREGHPVCYNVYGEFQNNELYQKMFSDEEKRMKFLRWRIQFLERSIRKLDFSPGGISTIFQVNDLKNSPGPAKKELRLATNQALQLLQDNYPEFVAKQVFVNAPWWHLVFYAMLSPFLTQRTKSKFVFASPARSAETLFKYISPEHVPIQYGGLSVDYCDCNPEFTIDDPVTGMPIKPGTKQTVEIIIYEKCIIVWEIRVVGWEVSYKAEFEPESKGAYTVIIQKPKKMVPTNEPVVTGHFKVSELGKLLLTVDNPTTKKKRLLYRFKVNPLSD